MKTSSTRVLVVEDSGKFRKFICSTLGERPELQIVGEESDGLQALQRADELQPDLILLDIGLPSMNGIEAARRIRKLSPKSKILFVSQESAADFVQEALALGALGYVVKFNAGKELLTAVEAVIQGRQYLSSGCRLTIAPTRPDTEKKGTSHSHEVEFYSDDTAFVIGFSSFIEAALEAGNAVIVIATESHRKSLRQRLQEHGVDVAAAIEQGCYLVLDVAETLSTFMVNDLPDAARCLQVAGNLVIEAAKAVQRDRSVAVCGECAPILWAQGKADAAIQVEHLWDEIARKHEVDILCGYVLNSFQREQESDVYERISAEHSAVYSR